MESDRYVYACALSRVFAFNCSDGRNLVDSLGSPSSVFSASRDTLLGLLNNSAAVVDQLLNPALLEWAAEEVEWAGSNGISLLALGDENYPCRLAECDDAPLLLYFKGVAELNRPRVLSVVGTRKASWYGRECCRKIVSHLATLDEKPLIVSGLALGIDGCAHAAALEAGLQTVAVLPTGIDEIYPRQHRSLAERIAENGALVSDFPRRTSPVAFNFLRRNRIIAGLADATLLAESYARGGGLITVSLAASYGREVFAVPGRLTDYSFEGCHAVISRNTAQIVSGCSTVPESMSWQSRMAHRRMGTSGFDSLPALKRKIVSLLRERSSLSADEISVLANEDVSDVSVALFELEVKGLVAVEFGNRYVIAG